MVTDADGTATALLDLSAVTPRPNATETVQLDLEWVGPTRERLTATDSTLLATNEYYILLSQSLATDIPGQAFALLATAMRRGDTDTTVAVPVEVTVRRVSVAELVQRREGGGDVDYTAAVYEVDSSVDGGERVCTIEPPVAGESPDWESRWADCRWSIPDVGAWRYEVTACATPGDERLCVATLYGKLESAWKKNPLTALPGVTSVWAMPKGADGFAVGSQALLYVEALSGKPHASGRLLWRSATESASMPVPGACLPLTWLHLTSAVLRPVDTEECVGHKWRFIRCRLFVVSVSALLGV